MLEPIGVAPVLPFAVTRLEILLVVELTAVIVSGPAPTV